MTDVAVDIRPTTQADAAAWRALWVDYLAFYDTVLPDEMLDIAFNRVLAGNAGAIGEFRGLLAWRGTRAVGLTHYLFHRHGWKREPVTYLQDLFVAPDRRGTGLGRALIEAVYTAADAAGAPTVYWLTAEDNAQARRLYDGVASFGGMIKYQR